MFAIYEILNHHVNFDLSNLKLFKKCESLSEFKSPIYHISKYQLMNEGWCFIMSRFEGESKAKYLIIDIESEKIMRKHLLPILRDLKLEEILN